MKARTPNADLHEHEADIFRGRACPASGLSVLPEREGGEPHLGVTHQCPLAQRLNQGQSTAQAPPQAPHQGDLGWRGSCSHTH